MIPRKLNGEVDIIVNVDKWTVATTVLDYCNGNYPEWRNWWALDPRHDIENEMPDAPYVPDRSERFDDFESALVYALTMAQGDAA